MHSTERLTPHSFKALDLAAHALNSAVDTRREQAAASVPATLRPIMSSGTRECICGQRISANRRYCHKCAETHEYMVLIMAKAHGPLPIEAEVRLKLLHERFKHETNFREQMASFAYGNVKLSGSTLTREMVTAQIETLFSRVEAVETEPAK